MLENGDGLEQQFEQHRPDQAIVPRVGLPSRDPLVQQKRVMIWGTAGIITVVQGMRLMFRPQPSRVRRREGRNVGDGCEARSGPIGIDLRRSPQMWVVAGLMARKSPCSEG